MTPKGFFVGSGTERLSLTPLLSGVGYDRVTIRSSPPTPLLPFLPRVHLLPSVIVPRAGSFFFFGQDGYSSARFQFADVPSQLPHMLQRLSLPFAVCVVEQDGIGAFGRVQDGV